MRTTTTPIEANPPAIGALVVVVALPAPLEEIRRREVAVAATGFPAHVTVLYPFASPASLTVASRRVLADVVAGVPAFHLAIGPALAWTDVTALGVAPADPFRVLIARVALAFPAFPPYEGRLELAEVVPHVTLADRPVTVPPPWADATIDAGVVDHVSWFGGRGDGWDAPIEIPLG